MTKVGIRALLVLFLFLFSIVLVKAQSQKGINRCQPTTDEILFVINPVKDWNRSFDGILVAGELKTTGILPVFEKSLSVMQLMAIVGGILKTAQQPIYIIRQTPGKTGNKIEVDLNKIKIGEAEDVSLKKGDIVFAPRGCANGKLLPMTESTNMLPQPRGVDAPTKFRVPIL